MSHFIQQYHAATHMTPLSDVYIHFRDDCYSCM